MTETAKKTKPAAKPKVPQSFAPRPAPANLGAVARERGKAPLLCRSY